MGPSRRGAPVRMWSAPVALTLLLAVVAGPAAAQDPPPAGDAAPTIVTFDDGAALRAGLAGDLRRADPGAEQLDARTALAELTPAEAQRLAADPAVAAVEADAPVHLAEPPNDPCYTLPATCFGIGAWHLGRTDLPTAWNLTHADGAVIAVLDSGVNGNVADLQGRIVGELVPGSVGPACTSDPQGAQHHGTEVAAVAVATPSNGIGTAGTGWGAQVLSIRVFQQGPSGCVASTSGLIAGLDLAVAAGVEVINLSLTTTMESVSLRGAIGRALAAGIPVIAAAGNSSTSDPRAGLGGFPAFWPEVIAVGATGPAGGDPRSPFSNFGSWVDLYAPGEQIPTFDRNGNLTLVQGTSFAAPVVAGIAAMLRTVAPWSSPADLSSQLRSGGSPVAGVGGAVRINAFSALVAAPASDHFARSTATPGSPDRLFSFGIGAYDYLLCDFDGDGIDGIVAFDRGNWYVRDTASPGPVQSVFSYGAAGYQPVCGDWDGNGGDGVGVFVGGNWYLRQTPSAGNPQLAYSYGAAGYQPVVGDWDGNGTDGTGVFVGGDWYLRQTPSAGNPQLAYSYGVAGYQPVVGDWDGNGTDGTGVYVGGQWHLRETASAGSPQRSFGFGFAGTEPLVGATGTPHVDGIAVTLP